MASTLTRVVVVAEYVDPARNSTGYYWHRIIRGLAAAGTDVAVVSTEESCNLALPFGPSVTCFPAAPGTGYHNRGVLSRFWGQLRLTLRLSAATLRIVDKRDAVFCGTNPLFLLVVLALLHRLRGFRWVLLVHDVFPENAVAAGLFSGRSIWYYLLKALFDRAYAQADVLIAIGRDMQEVLETKTKGRTLVELVPNWVSASAIATSSSGGIGPLMSQGKDAIVFQFFGNIGRVQGIDDLLEAIKKVRHPRAHFLFIGTGAHAEHVRRFALEDPARRVSYVPSLDFSRNNEGLLACDVAMISLAPGMKGLAVPSKAYFSMAADKPVLVIGDVGAELELMVRENPRVGWFCRSGDSDALARTIEGICEMDLTSITGQPRTLIESTYDCDQAIRRYMSILKLNREALS
jgi:glycosyltransferase involved in cell wall biosynthesis